MSIEINRLIRELQQLAESHSGADLFVKVYDDEGSLVSPSKDKYEYDNDCSDRIVVLAG